MENKVVNIEVKHNLDQTTISTNKLATGLKGAANATTELSGKSDGLGKLQSGIDAVGGAVGGLNPAFGAAIKGSNGLIIKMYELIANPVGAVLAAIVVTLKFLYEAFQSSVAGGKELKAAFAAVSAIGTQVKDAIFGLGRALIDVAAAAYKFITLDFKGAAESMKKANKEATESYKQLGNAVDGTTAKIAYNLEKQQQANDKARKLQAVVQSETNKLLVQSREILTDETASIKDKKKALEEVTKAEKASSAEKVRIAAEDLRIAKDRAKNLGGEAEKKAKQELRDLTVALNEAETENAMTGIKLNKQRKMLLRQETADAKEAADAQKLILKTNSEAKIKLQEEEAKRLKLAREQELKDNAKYWDDFLRIGSDKVKTDYENKKAFEEAEAELTKIWSEDRLNKLKKELADKEEAAKKEEEFQKNKDTAIALSKQNLTNIIAGLEDSGLAKTEAGQVIAKTLALTQIGIDSAVAISKASTLANAEGVAAQLAFPLVPGIGTIARIVSYASTAAGVISNISRAKQLLSSGGSGGGGSAPSSAAPSAPAAPSFNVVGNSGVNQVANVLNNQGMPPIKTYVIAGEVTTQEGLNRNIVSNATLG
jgi:hypothetical protein